MLNIILVKEPGIMRDGIELIIKEHLPNAIIESYSIIEMETSNGILNMPDLIIIEWKDNLNNTLQVVDYYLKRDVKVALLTNELNKQVLQQVLRQDVLGYLSEEMRPNEFVASIRNMVYSHYYKHPKY